MGKSALNGVPLSSQIIHLEMRVKQLEEDAQRYQWLRQYTERIELVKDDMPVVIIGNRGSDNDSFDKVIDYAMGWNGNSDVIMFEPIRKTETNPVLILAKVLQDTGRPLAKDFDNKIAYYALICEERLEGFVPGLRSTVEEIDDLIKASRLPIIVHFHNGVIRVS